jgi:hypothetical protein
VKRAQKATLKVYCSVHQYSLLYSSTYSHDLAAVLVGFPMVAQNDRELPRYSLHVTVQVLASLSGCLREFVRVAREDDEEDV